MDFNEVIKKRNMIREYQQDSAGHTQVQEFVVVIDPITKRKLCQASLVQHQVEDASVLIFVCSNTSRSVNRYGKRGTDLRY
jgi:hypothetical protein